MKMMGLPNWLHWTAWFVKSLAFILITIILITALLKVNTPLLSYVINIIRIEIWLFSVTVLTVLIYYFDCCLFKARWYGGSTLAVLEKSDGTLFFFFMLIFAITSISFCFLMTVFFSKGLFYRRNRIILNHVFFKKYSNFIFSQCCRNWSRYHLVRHVLAFLLLAVALCHTDSHW